jgi:hypothetical protein
MGDNRSWEGTRSLAIMLSGSLFLFQKLKSIGHDVMFSIHEFISYPISTILSPTTGNSGSPSITNMRSAILLSLGAASLVAAIPPTNKMAPTDKAFRVNPDLRLIKTSELDPGVWVTEEEKIVNYVSKKIGFIDITEITNATTLERLSTPQSELQSRAVAAVTYPSTLTHQTQANGFIASLSQTKPKAWLTTLTKYITLLINPITRDSG